MKGAFIWIPIIGMWVGGIAGVGDLLARIYNWAKYGSTYGSTICQSIKVGCDGLMPDWKGLNEIFIWFFNAPLSISGTLTFIACVWIWIKLQDDFTL